MKLLFVINQFNSGGAERSLLNLLKKLDKSKYDIDFIIKDQKNSEESKSLLHEIPNEVYVLDVQKQMSKFSIARKLKEKFLLTKHEKNCDPSLALLYVRNKEYDWAFHIGEWWSPAFTALKVHAKHKALWVHNDISQAEYFNAEEYFKYDNCIERYIFVSNNSMQSSLEAFPFIRDKSLCIYNINDAEDIRRKAHEKIIENYFELHLPVLVTCANVRQQKNHKRQLEAMALLKKRGVDFIWLNIGATVETERCEELLDRAKELGLEDKFILTGVRDNPYKYMSKADAVAVLSDYESWSMVITEAKILRTPVIATKTSGALEQIVDGETGVLTDFSATHIADQIEKFLSSKEKGELIRNNLKDFDNTDEILASFDTLVTDCKESKDKESHEILYVIDDINFQGGAHAATKLQICSLLKEGRKISIFSSSIPNVKIRTELMGVKFLGWAEFFEDRLFNRRLLNCLLDPTLTKEEKKYKLSLTWEGKFKGNPKVFSKMVLPKLSNIFSDFGTVCVMSESSGFREVVAKCQAKRKVQWIHTDYCDWKNKTKWTKEITKNDAQIYEGFDKIVVLTPGMQHDFCELYPHLAKKVVVNRNLLPVEKILAKGRRADKDRNLLNFVVVGRIDRWKACERLFAVLWRLYQEGYRSYWTIVGDGEDFNRIDSLFANSELSDYVELTGQRSNPYSFVREADVFALLSKYEGLPNTIFEALILGTPVIATNVGGVSLQIQDGKTGWLVENSEEGIYKGIKYILEHPEQVAQAKVCLAQYKYDNDEILRIAKNILFEE
ncbi:glycosyltransferase [Oscillospiraceae bacterium 50-16]